MDKQSVLRQGLKALWALVEVAAAIRAGLATWTVVNSVTHDQIYSLFTVLVVEGVFLSSLFLIGIDAMAVISALIALVFSGVMQYCEILVLDGAITSGQREILRMAIAFAPIVILGLAYLRRLIDIPTSGEKGVSANPFGFLLGQKSGESATGSILSSGRRSAGAKSLNMSVGKVKGQKRSR